MTEELRRTGSVSVYGVFCSFQKDTPFSALQMPLLPSSRADATTTPGERPSEKSYNITLDIKVV